MFWFNKYFLGKTKESQKTSLEENVQKRFNEGGGKGGWSSNHIFTQRNEMVHGVLSNGAVFQEWLGI